MRITTAQSALAKIAQRFQSAVTEKTHSQIGLRAESGKLEIALTDRAFAIFNEIPCETEQSGTVFVPSKFFIEILRELPPGTVTLINEDSWLKVSAENGFTIKLPVISNLTWREAPAWGNQELIAIPSAKLAYMIDQVQFCIAQESSRIYGTVGYLQKLKDNMIRLVGTDGFRLSYCDIKLDVPMNGFLDQGVCLSKRALSEIGRICKEGTENVGFAFSSDHTTILAAIPGYRLFILLSAANYPNYEEVLPKSPPISITVNRGTLQAVARRVLLASGKSRSLKLKLSDAGLTLSSKSAGSSEGSENIALKKQSGHACHLTLNGKFLSDVLSTTISDDLNIKFKDHEDPALIIPTNEPLGCVSRHILVPIREGEN